MLLRVPATARHCRFSGRLRRFARAIARARIPRAAAARRIEIGVEWRPKNIGHVLSCLSNCSYRSSQIVQAVANRPERWLVVPAVGRDVASRVLDRGGGLGERDHLRSLQQPYEPGLVVPG
jgi:hypothetical protein